MTKFGRMTVMELSPLLVGDVQGKARLTERK